MIRKETSKQLADSISKILNVAPALIDPECSDDCTAKITKGTVEEDDQEEAEINKSRKRYVDLQDVIGSRYAGKQGNRKNLGQTVEKWIENDCKFNDNFYHAMFSKYSLAHFTTVLSVLSYEPTLNLAN